MDCKQLVETLTRLGLQRDEYFISGVCIGQPSEDRLCLVRTKNNPYRTAVWKFFYVERGEQVAVCYFRTEAAAVGWFAREMLSNYTPFASSPVDIALNVFFHVFLKSWMSIDSLDFKFDESDTRGPAEVSGTCGPFRLDVDCAEKRLDIRLAMKGEGRFDGVLRTSIDKTSPSRNPEEESDDDKYFFFRESFLPAYRQIVAKSVPRDRFVTQDY